MDKRKIKTPLKERFWKKVDKTPGLGPNGDCWEWTAAKAGKGYGVIGYGKRCRNIYAHRASWMITYGDPGKLHVLHKCDNKLCVNPDHLFLGTNKDNVDDMKSKNRQPKGEIKVNAKLTENEVKAIRNSSLTHEKLADIYGVCGPTITKIKTRKKWRHVV